MYVCVAGKNQCSIDFVKFILKKIKKKNVLILPNKSDNGVDTWQPSLKKFAKKNNLQITSLKKIYLITKIIFISIEFEKIIKPNKFLSKKLFNFHFSLLPKYRGCHTNFFQIYNGEKYSGVTLHKIDDGIDTGPIIDKIKFPIKPNTTSYMNYLNLMKYSLKLLKLNFNKLLNDNYILKRQNDKNASYFSRNSVNYKKMKYFNLQKLNKKTLHKINAFIFPPFQLPIINNKIVKRIIINKKGYKILYG